MWEDFLKIVREEVGSRVVETWFKAVTITEWDVAGKVVYLSTPNAFICNWLEKNYRMLFQTHLGRLLNVANPHIIFINHTEKNDHEKKEVAPIETFKAARVIPYNNVYKKQGVIAQKHLSEKHQYHNNNYSFDTFVVGPSNSLAYAASCAVAQKPGDLYNPLFIYGGPGLGKTHLLHAIGNVIQENNKHASVLYQTADRFVSEFIHAIRFDTVHQFQKKYRQVDVLLIDDIQFISNKETTQEAFFHLFNSLYDARKQIVFSSDTFPQNIDGIAERLRSRLACGMVTDIHQPQLETKIAILKRKAERNGQIIDDEVTHFIASHIISNIRELEGVLIRIMAYAHLTQQPITLNLAQRVIFHQEQDKKVVVDLKRVARIIEKHFSFSLDQLKSKKRNKELAFVRQVTMYLMKKSTDKSLREIGAYLGGRNHATVKHALTKVEKQISKNGQLQRQITAIEAEL